MGNNQTIRCEVHCELACISDHGPWAVRLTKGEVDVDQETYREDSDQNHVHVRRGKKVVRFAPLQHIKALPEGEVAHNVEGVVTVCSQHAAPWWTSMSSSHRT